MSENNANNVNMDFSARLKTARPAIAAFVFAMVLLVLNLILYEYSDNKRPQGYQLMPIDDTSILLFEICCMLVILTFVLGAFMNVKGYTIKTRFILAILILVSCMFGSLLCFIMVLHNGFLDNSAIMIYLFCAGLPLWTVKHFHAYTLFSEKSHINLQ